MARDEHLERLRQGAAAWNEWRKQNPEMKPDLSGVMLVDMDLPGGDTIGLRRLVLDGFDLSHANLSNSVLFLTSLREANLREANLEHANLDDTNLFKATLQEACLYGAKVRRAQAEHASFLGADLRNADLEKAELSHADLTRAVLRNTTFASATMTHAKLWGAHCEFADFTEAKLHDASFFSATVRQCDFLRAEMQRANFSRADCFRSSFAFANAEGADFEKASLIGTGFIETDLRRAKLAHAVLEGALLIKTKLEGAELKYVRSYGASVWEITTDDETEQDVVVTTSEDENAVFARVNDLELAQFLFMVRDRAKFKKIFDGLTSRLVLLLGNIEGDGGERLQRVADRLRDLGPFRSQEYWPVIFDFGPPSDRNLQEGALLLVGLSKFVIADIGGQSVSHELARCVQNFRVPFVPIKHVDAKEYALFESYKEDTHVLPTVDYDDTDDLLRKLDSRIIRPAEEIYRKRRERLLEGRPRTP